jgi:hypothetical protein
LAGVAITRIKVPTQANRWLEWATRPVNGALPSWRFLHRAIELHYAAKMIGTIELTNSETALYKQVLEANDSIRVEHDRDTAIRAGEASYKLFQSLMERKAIPEQRLRYFADPSYNPSNTRASKRDLFLRNAHTDGAMYRHAHFWKYLIYFVEGAKLPPSISEQLTMIAKNEMREYNAASSYSRKVSRNLPGDRDTKIDEFFKLALDCGLPLDEALGVRRAVMQAK